MIGGKTGFTCNARHCFVGAIDTEKGLIYTAVLGAPSRSRLWKSTQLLADIGIRSLPGSLEPLVHLPRKDILRWKSDRTTNQYSLVGDAGFEDQIAHSDLAF
jgi:D-alanyl-D-alanine carboxypeptidase